MSKYFKLSLDNTKKGIKNMDFTNKFKLCFVNEKDLLLVIEGLRPVNIKEIYLSNANNVYKTEIDLPYGTTVQEIKGILTEIKKNIKKDYSDNLDISRFMIVG